MIRALSAVAIALVASALPAQPEPASEYVIGIGDVLRISVWRNEELETVAPVRPDGRVSAVLVGDVEVAGLTPREIREVLTRRYGQYVNAPGVSVVVSEINSRRVFVLGEVAEPGVYGIGQPTRLLQALAMAGGMTEFAKKDQVVLLRDVEGARQRYVLSFKAVVSGAQLENDVLLEPGDTIVVP